MAKEETLTEIPEEFAPKEKGVLPGLFVGVALAPAEKPPAVETDVLKEPSNLDTDEDDGFKESVREAGERAKTDFTRDHNHSVAQMHNGNPSLKNGRRGHSQFHSAGASGEAVQKKREKDASAYRRALKAYLNDLDRQLEALEKQIAGLRKEIEQLESKRQELLDELDEVEGRMAKDENGQIDWAHYAEENGIEQREGESDEVYKARAQEELLEKCRNGEVSGDILLRYQILQNLDAVDEDIRIRNEKIDVLEQESQDIKEDYNKSVKRSGLSGVSQGTGEDYEETKKLASRGIDVRGEQKKLEAYDGVENKAQFDRKSETDSKEISVDKEVGNFMVEFERAKTIENDMERLTREQDLVQGLSDEARENVSWEKSTEHLFEDGYFAQLDAGEEGVKTAQLTTNIFTQDMSLG